MWIWLESQRIPKRNTEIPWTLHSISHSSALWSITTTHKCWSCSVSQSLIHTITAVNTHLKCINPYLRINQTVGYIRDRLLRIYVLSWNQRARGCERLTGCGNPIKKLLVSVLDEWSKSPPAHFANLSKVFTVDSPWHNLCFVYIQKINSFMYSLWMFDFHQRLSVAVGIFVAQQAMLTQLTLSRQLVRRFGLAYIWSWMIR